MCECLLFAIILFTYFPFTYRWVFAHTDWMRFGCSPFQSLASCWQKAFFSCKYSRSNVWASVFDCAHKFTFHFLPAGLRLSSNESKFKDLTNSGFFVFLLISYAAKHRWVFLAFQSLMTSQNNHLFLSNISSSFAQFSKSIQDPCKGYCIQNHPRFQDSIPVWWDHLLWWGITAHRAGQQCSSNDSGQSHMAPPSASHPLSSPSSCFHKKWSLHHQKSSQPVYLHRRMKTKHYR
jgi:hypothetical protein